MYDMYLYNNTIDFYTTHVPIHRNKLDISTSFIYILLHISHIHLFVYSYTPLCIPYTSPHTYTPPSIHLYAPFTSHIPLYTHYIQIIDSNSSTIRILEPIEQEIAQILAMEDGDNMHPGRSIIMRG